MALSKGSETLIPYLIAGKAFRLRPEGGLFFSVFTYVTELLKKKPDQSLTVRS